MFAPIGLVVDSRAAVLRDAKYPEGYTPRAGGGSLTPMTDRRIPYVSKAPLPALGVLGPGLLAFLAMLITTDPGDNIVLVDAGLATGQFGQDDRGIQHATVEDERRLVFEHAIIRKESMRGSGCGQDDHGKGESRSNERAWRSSSGSWCWRRHGKTLGQTRP
jgi:hypothetical protein